MTIHFVTASREELIEALRKLLWFSENVELNEESTDEDQLDEFFAAQEAARKIIYGES